MWLCWIKSLTYLLNWQQLSQIKQVSHFPKPKTIGRQIWPPHPAAIGPATPLHRNYHLITVGLFFIHETIGCVHQTRPRKGTRHSATCFAHTYWSPYLYGVRPLGCYVKNESFSSSSMNCMSMDSITEVFYNLNKMLIATKHIADNNLIFQ